MSGTIVVRDPTRWTLVIPVRRGGKSRLRVTGVDRAALARAIALDTIAVAASVAEVIVVTDEAIDVLGIRVVADPGRGLNAAAGAGLRVAEAGPGGGAGPRGGGASARGEGAGPRGVLLGDLPALRADDLRAALQAAASVDLGVVSDAAGTGTTLVTARAGTALHPSFGEGSYARHRAGGFLPLEIAAESTLHLDVDTAADLEVARMRGLGPRTAAVLGIP